jgi:hypothetical protein
MLRGSPFRGQELWFKAQAFSMKSSRTNHDVRAFQECFLVQDNAIIVKKSSNSDLFVSIAQFHNAHVVQLSISDFKSDKGSFLMETMHTACSRIDVQPAPALVSFDQ